MTRILDKRPLLTTSRTARTVRSVLAATAVPKITWRRSVISRATLPLFSAAIVTIWVIRKSIFPDAHILGLLSSFSYIITDSNLITVLETALRLGIGPA